LLTASATQSRQSPHRETTLDSNVLLPLRGYGRSPCQESTPQRNVNQSGMHPSLANTGPGPGSASHSHLHPRRKACWCCWMGPRGSIIHTAGMRVDLHHPGGPWRVMRKFAYRVDAAHAWVTSRWRRRLTGCWGSTWCKVSGDAPSGRSFHADSDPPDRRLLLRSNTLPELPSSRGRSIPMLVSGCGSSMK
jgi:hypothetical protein